MRIPAPVSLLVEHPATPLPAFGESVLDSPLGGDQATRESLSRQEKFSASVQLTAAASLLGEFDLWPGRAAIRDARFVRTGSGVRAVLDALPLPMSRVFARLGGGERAAATTRSAVLGAISEAVALPLASLDHDKGEPGFFLERAIGRQLRELRKPLDRCTARALWAFRWDGLPMPEEGAMHYWEVPIAALAGRLATALWASLRRGGGEVWLQAAGTDGLPTLLAGAGGKKGTVILVGESTRKELAGLSRWVEGEGCSAVAIGGFPSGWHPPRPPSFDADDLYRHLAVTGMPLADARRVVEHRQGRFDPFDSTDRRALTETARRIFAPPGPSRKPRTRDDTPSRRLWRTLSLSPDGLPAEFVAVHSGLSRSVIAEHRDDLAIVERDGSMRLAEVAPLEPDPLHTAVADLLDDRDPRRWLHRALGTGNTVELAAWARSRLDELDGYAVRDLLSIVSAGALGHEVGMLLAEACLSIYDISGARRALRAIPHKLGDALGAWLEGLDDRAGVRRRLPEEAQLEVAPRAVAESVILVLNEVRRSGQGRTQDLDHLIDRARERLAPLIRRRIDIDLAWIADQGEFDDPTWRRTVVGTHPALRAHYAHRRALQLMDRGRPRAVKRLLELLSDDRMGPGFLGLVEQDLGATALDEGRSRDADRHQLRACRLLEAAGFQHLTHRVLFNLAVSDLDQLEIDHARRRFAELSDGEANDPFVTGELARLALAQGDLEAFRCHLASFEQQVDGANPRFSEGLRLLQGVAALLGGDLSDARRFLQHAGQEGVAWFSLANTLDGREPEAWQADAWGVSLAADLLHEARTDGGRVRALLADQNMTRSLALAIALAEHLGHIRMPITEAIRLGAIRVLREGGMDGWANALIAGIDRPDGVVEALARIVERGGPDDLPSDLAARLLVALGVSGLEIRDAVDGGPIWQVGDGIAGSEMRQGRIVIVPLGGEIHEGPAWRLVSRVLELCSPIATAATGAAVEETGFFGISTAARSVRRELRELGPSHLPVLLEGETGVGKEVAARALHRLSKRHGAFVAVNVAAIPSSLLEAELFGSVKGAFTGADRSRQGLAMAANGGTLFLDEVGDLDPPLQVKLLRFLDSQEVRPVGATRSKTVDVRIVSATHRNLERWVQEGRFRQDLYFRIAAPALTIPPLRDRRDDIGLLREIFEREAEARHGIGPCTWSGEAEALLRRYHWPGNVRELRQAVEVALVRARGGLVRPEHLPITSDEPGTTGRWDEAQRDFRVRFLKAALERNHGNRTATARELGISRQALLYHLKKLGISGPEVG